MKSHRALLAVLAAASVSALATPGLAQNAMGEDREAGPSGEGRRTGLFTTDSPFDLNITLEAMSDYVSLRGFSQTDREPAIQGTVDASFHDFHAGFFASNVYFGTPEPDTEFDPFIAYRPTVGNWSFDLTAYYYVYLDADEQNYPEIFSTASYTFEDIATLGATFAVAPDYFGDDRETGYFYKTSLAVPLPNDFEFSGSVGYQDFEEGLFNRHLVWDAGLTYTFKDTFSFDVRYHDTDLDADRQCTDTFKCDATVVGTLTFTTGLKKLMEMAAAD